MQERQLEELQSMQPAARGSRGGTTNDGEVSRSFDSKTWINVVPFLGTWWWMARENLTDPLFVQPSAVVERLGWRSTKTWKCRRRLRRGYRRGSLQTWLEKSREVKRKGLFFMGINGCLNHWGTANYIKGRPALLESRKITHDTLPSSAFNMLCSLSFTIL